MLFSHGARFGGHALYIKDGTLKYVYNFVGRNEQIVDVHADVSRRASTSCRPRSSRRATDMPTHRHARRSTSTTRRSARAGS